MASDHLTLDARLARAGTLCAKRAVRLTDTRREVLSLILTAGEPVSAYALLDRLRAATGKGQPPTVYRALDFLLAQGLIHRIERLNAFVPCHDEQDHPHPVQFMICGSCGAAKEIEDPAIDAAIKEAATRENFILRAAMIELDGTCAACAG
jgi:Fur family zinc uptake transcriptional regulator